MTRPLLGALLALMILLAGCTVSLGDGGVSVSSPTDSPTSSVAPTSTTSTTSTVSPSTTGTQTATTTRGEERSTTTEQSSPTSTTTQTSSTTTETESTSAPSTTDSPTPSSTARPTTTETPNETDTATDTPEPIDDPPGDQCEFQHLEIEVLEVTNASGYEANITYRVTNTHHKPVRGWFDIMYRSDGGWTRWTDEDIYTGTIDPGSTETITTTDLRKRPGTDIEEWRAIPDAEPGLPETNSCVP